MDNRVSGMDILLMTTKLIVLLAALALLIFGTPTMTQAQTETQIVDEPAVRAELAVAALHQWYNMETGLWETTNWWNAANALYVVIDYGKRTGDTTYEFVVENTWRRNVDGGFLNEYYDDMGWWALTWIHAYDWLGDERYLNTAKSIFWHMTSGWDETCGGGIWWRKDRQYKNAIANELFLQLAARLYNRTQEASYLDWATRTWDWFDQTGMINELNLVNDGLRDCENNRDITWTYNQGVILGGLVELYRATGDAALLQQAEAIADAAITLLIDDNGILREPCELAFNCGADGPQFKGIFMRNLGLLNTVSNKPAYTAFIELNANSIWTNARNDDNQLGLNWGRRFDRADAARQSSALDALLVAIL
jgi:predicted alpha-1,6-mannanase (GH76 family)